MANLPAFASLQSHYPTGSPEVVKKRLGGKVDAAWLLNTCAIRVSAALNGAGHPLPSPRHSSGMHVVSGADGKWYAYRVTELARYLERRYGAPTQSIRGDLKTMTDALDAKTGIIRFDIAGWNDATGHLDLWDGRTCADKCYFLYAPGPRTTGVWLWEC